MAMNRKSEMIKRMASIWAILMFTSLLAGSAYAVSLVNGWGEEVSMGICLAVVFISLATIYTIDYRRWDARRVRTKRHG